MTRLEALKVMTKKFPILDVLIDKLDLELLDKYKPATKAGVQMSAS